MSSKLFNNRFIGAYRLMKKAYGNYKKHIILLAVLGFISGLLEGIGINALIPLFSILLPGEEGAGTDVITETIRKVFEFFGIGFNLVTILMLIAVMFIGKALLLHLINYVTAVITANYEKNQHNHLFRTTILARWPYLIKQKIGYLEKVLTMDINNSASLLTFLSGAILTITSLIVYVIIALNISAIITLSTVALGLTVFLIFKRILFKIRKTSEKYAASTKRVANFINEHMIGIKTVKAAGAEPKVSLHGSKIVEDLKNQRIKISVYRSLSTVFLQPISVIFIALVFAFYNGVGSFSFGAFVAVMYLIYRIFTQIQKFQRDLQQINEHLPYLRSAVDYQNQADENQEEDKGTKDFIFKKELKFDAVEFSYPNEKPVLSKVNFSVKKGEIVGLVGPSGAGKTTLVDLILRLLQPTKGKILIDGQDVSKIRLSSWRRNLGYVSQDLFLINATIEDNIRFYDEQISPQAIIEGAKQANIYDFIQTQPQKFQTPVGERGSLLSGGQRQRVVLARVLARSPQILILDEATSALDNESETLVQQAIERLRGKVTVIVIAHRLSSVLNSDRIVVLDQGKIIEQGKPKELLKNKDSYFHKLYYLRQSHELT